MEVFLNNFIYMWFNSFLAVVPILFGWLMSKAKSNLAKIWTGIIWLLFLPNTIYILTDISHIFEDWPKIDAIFKVILIIQYFLFSIFGIVSFVVCIYFLQKVLENKPTDWKIEKMKPSTFIIICLVNFAVGFAVIMGGIERTNSWYVFTNPMRVIQDVLDVFSSSEMLMLAGGIGALANVIYFLTLESVITWGDKYINK